MNPDVFFGILSQVLLAVSVPYFLVMTIMGVSVARRRTGSLRAQETVAYTDGGKESPYELYVLVPCLNEAAVVGATVTRLLEDPGCQVVVVDDGSTDDTGPTAARAAADLGRQHRLTVLTRTPPDARRGKGAALNAALRHVVDETRRRGLDPAQVVVVVMDADGRLSDGGLRAPLSEFDDPRVGAVQLAVRIRNRRKLIARFQDVEFWSISALSQFARVLSGTVSLGGNGQFTRLSALLSLPGDPWTDSLTEDLELGLRLVEQGWRTTLAAGAYVDQQGVESYSRLLRQRTRWYQGTMTSIRRLPALWRSPRVGQVALLEVTAYLMVPWVVVLPWSLLQQWILYRVVFGGGQGIFATGLGSVPATVVYAAVWYILSFLPNILVGLLYSRRTKAVSLLHAFALGHLMLLWNYIGYAATWLGLVRMLRGRNTWDKTARTSESPSGARGVALPAALSG